MRGIQLPVLVAVFTITFIQGTIAQSPRRDAAVQRAFFERGKINGNLSYTVGRIIDYKEDQDGALDLNRPVYRFKNIVSLNLGINLFESVYFRTTWYYNLNKNINAPWIIADYSYVLERAKWSPNTFSYGYVNYELNKYTDNMNVFLKNLSRGSFFIRYYNEIPGRITRRFSLDSTANLSYYFMLKYAVKYWNSKFETTGDILNGKPVISFDIKYVIVKNIYIEGTAHYYPVNKTKRRWDPDFTYGFGYNSYKHLSLGFTYGNYSMNRFPWNEKEVKSYGFLDGNFSLLLNYRW